MKKIRLLPIILMLCLLLSVFAPSALALEDPQVDAGAVVLADTVTGRIFFSKNADEKMYPASLTKIMTALLVIEAADRGDVLLTDLVTASVNCTQDMVADGSTAGIQIGETMPLEELLYCALVESANESCNVLAEYIGGSISGFVDMMNARAIELGCQNTHFMNPHGLHNDNHYTTANDMYIITRMAMSHELFMEICNTVSHTVPATNLSAERELTNTNGLINADSKYYKGYYYEYAKGIKTGHTSAAGYCLISTAEKDGMNLLAVVMKCEGWQNGDGSNSYGNFIDSIAMYNWVFDNFAVVELLSSAELVTEVPVEMAADSDTVTLRPRNVVTALIPKDMDVSTFSRNISIYSEATGETLRAPIPAGTVLGEISISKDGVVYGSAELVTSTSVELSKLEYLKEQMSTAMDLVWVKVIFWLLIAALVAYLVLVVRYRILHKRHLEDVRRVRQQRAEAREREESTRVFSEARDRRPEPPVQRQPRQPQPPQQPPQPPQKPRPVEREPVRSVTPGKSGGMDDKARREYFEEFFRSGSDDGKKH